MVFGFHSYKLKSALKTPHIYNFLVIITGLVSAWNIPDRIFHFSRILKITDVQVMDMEKVNKQTESLRKTKAISYYKGPNK